MKYFSVSMDKEYTDTPRTVNWYGRINIESIMNCRYEQLEDIYALEIKGGFEVEPTDIVMDPIFAVSPMVKYCLETYEPNMQFTSLYFVQRKEEKIFEYYIPHLREEKCLKSSGSNFKKLPYSGNICIDLKKLPKDRFIFRINDEKNSIIVISSILLESILRRGACGMRLESIECVE